MVNLLMPGKVNGKTDNMLDAAHTDIMNGLRKGNTSLLVISFNIYIDGYLS